MRVEWSWEPVMAGPTGRNGAFRLYVRGPVTAARLKVIRDMVDMTLEWLREDEAAVIGPAQPDKLVMTDEPEADLHNSTP